MSSQGKNLYAAFLRTASERPAALACHDIAANDRCTYGMLRERIDATAASLEAVGVKPAQCIGLHVGSGLTYIVLAYALWRLGSVVVPIPTEITSAEKAQICASIAIDGVLTVLGSNELFASYSSEPARQLNAELVFQPTRRQLEPPLEFPQADAAFIRFTSGTTSTAKGVVLSHSTVFDRIHAANKALHISHDDTIVWLLSMSYHFTVSIVAYLTFGAGILICSDHFGDTIVEEAETYGGTLIYGSPQHYALMAGDRSNRTLGKVRLAISTASALKPEIARAFHERFGKPLSQAYGIIEVGLPCINLAGEILKPGSVGTVLPDYEIRLQGPSTELFGAIEVRGVGLLDAYYSPWRPRDEIMHEGWFQTGDLGRFDDDGHLYVTGRVKELISVGGMKFFPQEVEKVLEAHPLVLEAYVFPEPHPRLGEIPHALVRLKHGELDEAIVFQQLLALCREQLAAFKVPVGLRVVEHLPRTGSGKLKRRSV